MNPRPLTRKQVRKLPRHAFVKMEMEFRPGTYPKEIYFLTDTREIPDSHDVGLSKRLRFVHTIKYFRVA
jgi:hypothetical protein